MNAMIRVVNIRTYKGPSIYVGRAGGGRRGHPLANPFKLPPRATQADREECLRKYEAWLAALPGRDELLNHLANEIVRRDLPVLACWCWPNLCHATTLAREVEKILEARR